MRARSTRSRRSFVAPGNANRVPPAVVAKMRRSFVPCGNHRLELSRDLGFKASSRPDSNRSASGRAGTGLRLPCMRQGPNDQSEQSMRTRAELGRLLAAAGGYRVVVSDGTQLGWLDSVRYERHADHPDEIVVRRRGVLPRRRRALPFSAVEAVRPGERTVVLRVGRGALGRSPSA